MQAGERLEDLSARTGYTALVNNLKSKTALREDQFSKIPREETWSP